jgi:hypothetical protein
MKPAVVQVVRNRSMEHTSVASPREVAAILDAVQYSPQGHAMLILHVPVSAIVLGRVLRALRDLEAGDAM